jgi:hypothetical protein
MNTHSMFCGLMTKHHLVQIEPVAIRARFWVMESLSAGRTKSDAPARTTPHFMTGALSDANETSVIAVQRELDGA